MAYDRFMIAPFNTGLETDLRPWMIPEDAFSLFNNAYVFRGRVKKRFGSRLMGSGWSSVAVESLYSRLRINIGVTPGPINIPDVENATQLAIGQQFSIKEPGFDDYIFTVYQLGAGVVTLSTNPAITCTIDSTVTPNTVTFAGAAAGLNVFYYPATPVMGLTNYLQGPVNNQPSYGFDTQFAYLFTGGQWVRSRNTAVDTPIWHGTNIDFFWATNWTGITDNIVTMFVSNYFVANPNGLGTVNDDPIWRFNNIGVTPWLPFSYSPDSVLNPTNDQPLTVTQTTAANNQIIQNYVQTARIILPFKDRLVMLRTIENNANGATAFNPAMPLTTGITPDALGNYVTSTNTEFKNRCRYSHNGSPLASNAWLEKNQTYNPGATGTVNADGGGFIDAPTDEAIISAEFVKDRLIVYFERSTWELAYTGNQVLPFVWQQLNTELGADATFSAVPFDKMVLGIGNTGVHSCNGSNVERIDNKIPDQIFQIKNKSEGVKRVAGVRDYFSELVYWTFPASYENPDFTFPNRVLVFNYRNGSWAFNTDCITTWGYFEQQTDITWSSTSLTWEQYNATWISGVLAANFREVIAGNQEGFVYIVDSTVSRNCPAMQITELTILGTGYVDLTVINHTLDVGEWVAVENAQGINSPINTIYQVTQLDAMDPANKLTIFAPDITAGTYTGGGTLARVSNIQIRSKQWNPYVSKGRNVYVAKIVFGVQKTSDGEITIDYFPSSTDLSMVTEGQATGSIIGTSVLETSPYPTIPLEAQQDRVWHPVYFQTDGECIQIEISLSDAQISNPAIAWEKFTLEGIILYTMPTSQRLQ